MQIPGFVNYGLAGVLILACLFGCGVSMFLFALDALGGQNAELQSIQALDTDNAFTLSAVGAQNFQPQDSPANVTVRVRAPALQEGDTLLAVIDDGDKILSTTDCLEPYYEDGSYVGKTTLDCDVAVPYSYSSSEKINVRMLYAPLQGDSKITAPVSANFNWADYEGSVWGFGLVMLAAIALGLAVVVLPLSGLIYWLSTKEKHHVRFEGEYSLSTMVNPFKNAKTPADFIMGFIASPLFWVFEIMGVLAIVLYLFAHSGALESGTAMLAFFISGGIAFFTPFLWVVAWWLADYKEREPLRIIASLFLWGCLSCLLAIGLNSFTGSLLFSIGAGALTAAMVAPIVEEFMKGAGLGIFSLHHEYDNLSDGLVYGFTVGMGFAFIENWLYFINNPMGASISAWVTLFLMRSIAFSAMHGVYTSMTGGIIGFLKERKLPHMVLFLPALLPAMFFHSVHNSSELIGALFGQGAALVHCCLIMPLFDYAGLTLVAIAMLVGLIVLKHKSSLQI